MNFVDPSEPLETQLERQSKIIDALVQRATRQNRIGTTAYSAFQSAIELQAQVAAKTRDLEQASTELERIRFDQARTRKNLDDALAAMEGGFALFTQGRLVVWNDLFQNLLPDVQAKVQNGLFLEQYFTLVSDSAHLISCDRQLFHITTALNEAAEQAVAVSVVMELEKDRWFQLNVQRTSSENVMVLYTDITPVVRQSRLEKENLIDRQAAYLQAMFENMTSGVCTFSAAGEVIMFNNPFRELLGLPYTVLRRGAPIKDLLKFMRAHALIADETLDAFDDWRLHLQTKGSLHLRIRRTGGRVLELRANMLTDRGFLLELQDITLETRATEDLENRVLERTAELTAANERLTRQSEEQARVEEELRHAKERAEAAVSSKTRFLAAASHDLLQPINAAKLMLNTMLDTSKDTRFAPNVTRLYRAFTSIETLLHSLLDISRLDSSEADMVQPTDVCLGVLMQGIYEDQSALAEQKSVTLDVVPSTIFVRSDPIYLLRSLQNLVVNAIQYNTPGGRVLVGCRRRGDKVVLEVWDTGIGISLRDQKRIFDEFTRADNVPAGSGVGLGLSVVERACRHLGHRLWVRSKPGVGSVFYIEMDHVAPPKHRNEPDRLPQPSGHLPLNLIVLLIENDPDVLFATTEMLEHWGADVIAVSSTDEALVQVQDMGMPPDIILADYQLNDADTGLRGIDAIRKLTGTQVPAILITADKNDMVVQAAAAQDTAVLSKPLQVSRLRPLIDWKLRAQALGPSHDAGRAPTKVEGDNAR